MIVGGWGGGGGDSVLGQSPSLDILFMRVCLIRIHPFWMNNTVQRMSDRIYLRLCVCPSIRQAYLTCVCVTAFCSFQIWPRFCITRITIASAIHHLDEMNFDNKSSTLTINSYTQDPGRPD